LASPNLLWARVDALFGDGYGDVNGWRWARMKKQ